MIECAAKSKKRRLDRRAVTLPGFRESVRKSLHTHAQSMNSKTNFRSVRRALGAGLLFCSAVLAPATTLVTFQVDMSLDSSFDPTTQTVAARGSFNGWSAFALTNNPNGPNPSLWTGTTNIPTNGVVMSYKYTIEPGANYETISGNSQNRLAILPAASGSSLVLTPAYYNDADSSAGPFSFTFQVDMAQQINVGTFVANSATLFTRGSFNGWAEDYAMTNDPSILTTNQYGLVSSNVYVMTYASIYGSPGENIEFKYCVTVNGVDHWESPPTAVSDTANNNNRFFDLAGSTNQVLPVIYFNNAPYAPVVTSLVTFQVDMTAQVLNGNFDPTTDTVEVRGDFNGWGTPQILCTNNPAAANTNLYTAVVSITDGVGSAEQYKFWASITLNTGWETMADNRSFVLANASSQVLPVVYFSDLSPDDLLPADTLVTFQVSMTNAVSTYGHAFDSATDQLFINGPPSGNFANWDTTLPELTNSPAGSGIYSIQILIPMGSPIQQTYKYGINDGVDPLDNEAPSGSNHVRYVRSAGAYVMPLDTFGNQFVEPSFGNLEITLSPLGHALISWLGRPGVHLQTRGSLSSGS